MSEPKDPRELFNLLCERVQQFSMAPGGIPALTQEDIAHALGKIQVVRSGDHVLSTDHLEEAILLARIKFADERQHCEEFVLALRRIVGLRVDARHWKIPRANFILDMCWMALIEVIDPACDVCEGIAYRVVHSKPVVCPECNGSGRFKITNERRAGFMLCSPSAWSQSWSERYLDIRAIPMGWVEEIGPALKRKTKVNQLESA